MPFSAFAAPDDGVSSDADAGQELTLPEEADTGGDGTLTDEPDEPEGTEADEPDEAEETEGAAEDETIDDGAIDDDAVDGEDPGLVPLAVSDYYGKAITISSAVNREQRIDIPGQSLDNGAKPTFYASHTAPNQRFKLVDAGSGYFYIENINSGLVLDISGSSLVNPEILQWKRLGGNNQKWMLVANGNGYYIVSKLNANYCLDTANGTVKNGTLLTLKTKSAGRASQEFYLSIVAPTVANGIYFVKQGSQLMDIEKSSFADSAKVLLYTEHGGLNQRYRFVFNPGTGYYTITNINSNKALDVPASGREQGTPIIQYATHGGQNQQWSIEAGTGSGNFTIRASYTTYALTSATSAQGSSVVVATLTGKSNQQQWQFVKTAMIGDGLYNVDNPVLMNLDVYNNETTDGTNIELWTKHDGFAQKFYLRSLGAAGGDTYTIESASSGKLLTVSGTNVVLRSYASANDTPSDYQKWVTIPVGNGRFQLRNVATNKMLGSGSSSKKGANISVENSSAHATQQWAFKSTDPLPEGLYFFESAKYPGYVFDVPESSKVRGTQIELYAKHDGANQQFMVKALGDGSYRLTNLSSAKALDVSESKLTVNGTGKVVQWDVTTSANQRWYFEYVSKGNYRIVSVLEGGRACLTAGSGAKVVPLGLLNKSDTLIPAQSFKPSKLGSVSYEYLDITVSQMVGYQFAGNSYLTEWGISRATLTGNIDPDAQAANHFYQFLDIRVSTGLTGAHIDAYINSNSQGRAGEFYGRGQDFVDAGQAYGVNEVFLASLAIHESGWGTSTLSRGYYYDGLSEIGGVRYPAGTYYNFFGIGAVDTNVIGGGRALAVKNGWNTQRKAIFGGAKWIADNYTYCTPISQPTLYGMKWDYLVSNNAHSYAWHQYATGNTWAQATSNHMYLCYRAAGVTPAAYYIVPVYKR
jgi:beta-N-acetylglucosaminidase